MPETGKQLDAQNLNFDVEKLFLLQILVDMETCLFSFIWSLYALIEIFVQSSFSLKVPHNELL